MELSREKQIELRRALNQKINVDRFKARRTWTSLALDLETSEITVRASVRRDNARGKLTPMQLDYVRLMRSEYDKHEGDFKEFSAKAIADRLGISERTVQRWTERVLNERRVT